jgi:hypothetical protein
MTFERLRGADWVAFIAALLLLLVTAMDWYSSVPGENARDAIERIDDLPPAADDRAEVREDAVTRAEEEEQNAWQAGAAVDRLILAGLLATVGLGMAAAFLRAAGRRFEPPWTPSGLTAMAATLTAVLVAYRIVQEPGLDAATTVKLGAPLAAALLGAIAFASGRALQAEEAGEAFREVSTPEEAPAGGGS